MKLMKKFNFLMCNDVALLTSLQMRESKWFIIIFLICKDVGLRMRKLNFFINFINFIKLQNLMTGYNSGTYLLQKMLNRKMVDL